MDKFFCVNIICLCHATVWLLLHEFSIPAQISRQAAVAEENGTTQCKLTEGRCMELTDNV